MSCVWFDNGQTVPLCWKFEMSRTNSGDLHEREARQAPSQMGKREDDEDNHAQQIDSEYR